MYKKILIILLGLVLLSGICFGLEKPDEWAEESVLELENLGHFEGIFSAYKDDITRGEFIYIAVRMYEVLTNEEVVVDQSIYFSDTDDVYPLKGATLGITEGMGGGKFGYDDLLTREQLATLMVRVLTILDIEMIEPSSTIFADDDSISSWAKSSIYMARSNQIISGVGNNNFDPNDTASKQVAIIVANNILKAKDGKSAKNQRGQNVITDIHAKVMKDYSKGAVILKPNQTDLNPNLKGDYPFVSLNDYANDEYFFGSIGNLLNSVGHSLVRVNNSSYISPKHNNDNIYLAKNKFYFANKLIEGDEYLETVDELSVSISLTYDDKINYISFQQSLDDIKVPEISDEFIAILRNTGIKDLDKIFYAKWTNYYENGSLLNTGQIEIANDGYTISYYLYSFAYSCRITYNDDLSYLDYPGDFIVFLNENDLDIKLKGESLSLNDAYKTIMTEKYGVEDVYKDVEFVYSSNTDSSLKASNSSDVYVRNDAEEIIEYNNLNVSYTSDINFEDSENKFQFEYLVNGNSDNNKILFTVNTKNVPADKIYNSTNDDIKGEHKSFILSLFTDEDLYKDIEEKVYNFSDTEMFGHTKGPIKMEFYNNYNSFYLQY